MALTAVYLWRLWSPVLSAALASVAGHAWDRSPRPRTRRARLAPGLLVLAVLAAPTTVRTLASASPPDPSWIPGVYDGADYDDVVTLVTAQSGTPGSSAEAAPSAVPLAERPAPPAAHGPLGAAAPTVHSRAPPA